MTPAKIRQFCNDARDLAASINCFVRENEAALNDPAPQFTARERRRVDLALMVPETALESLCGKRVR